MTWLYKILTKDGEFPMTVSTIQPTGKQGIQVYAAKAYTVDDPCYGYVEINTPENLPSTPMDDSLENYGLTGSYFVNTNYPTSSVAYMSHCLRLPIMAGTPYPVTFPKGTPFMLITANSEVEDGKLVYINTVR